MLKTRLRNILEQKGISKEELAEMCDLPVETIRNIYYGKTPDPKVSTVMKLSRALGISVNCLMGECSHSSDERMLLNHFRECGNHGKNVLLLKAKLEALMAKEERDAEGKHAVPCLLPRGNIYQGIVYDDCDVVDVYTPKEEAFIGIQMTKNELAPLYCKGDIILVENRFPENREYGVFYQNGYVYIRQYLEEEDRFRLKCLHNNAQDMVFTRMDEIEYLGTCCSVVRA